MEFDRTQLKDRAVGGCKHREIPGWVHCRECDCVHSMGISKNPERLISGFS